MKKIYISSTSKDLKKERAAVRDAILGLSLFPVGMETDPASEKRPLDLCLQQVESCDIYIGIIAWRYGYVPDKNNDDNLSITRLEYEKAGEKGIDRFLFLLQDDAPWKTKFVDQNREEICGFRRLLENNHKVKYFENPDELKAHVNQTLTLNVIKGQQPIGPTEEKQEVPDLLPYLVNRSDQDDKIERKLSEKGESPTLFIVHGDEFQAHEKYFEKIKTCILPRVLDSSGSDLSVKGYNTLIPQTPLYRDFRDRMTLEIGKKVLKSGKVDTECINDFLSKIPVPVLFHSQLLSEDFQSDNSGPVENFLKFWKNWPPLKTGQVLVVCLFIKYQKKEGLTKMRKFKKINSNIHQALNNIKLKNGEVLPMLGNIWRTHCESWAQEEETMKYNPNSNILADIRNLYDKWEMDKDEDSIPMETIGKELKRLLQRS